VPCLAGDRAEPMSDEEPAKLANRPVFGLHTDPCRRIERDSGGAGRSPGMPGKRAPGQSGVARDHKVVEELHSRDMGEMDKLHAGVRAAMTSDSESHVSGRSSESQSTRVPGATRRLPSAEPNCGRP
jgi:hypothetical protein